MKNKNARFYIATLSLFVGGLFGFANVAYADLLWSSDGSFITYDIPSGYSSNDFETPLCLDGFQQNNYLWIGNYSWNGWGSPLGICNPIVTTFLPTGETQTLYAYWNGSTYDVTSTPPIPPVENTGIFANVDFSNVPADIGAGVVETGGNMWKLVAVAIALPLTFWLIMQLAFVFSQDAKDQRRVERMAKKASDDFDELKSKW